MKAPALTKLSRESCLAAKKTNGRERRHFENEKTSKKGCYSCRGTWNPLPACHKGPGQGNVAYRWTNQPSNLSSKKPWLLVLKISWWSYRKSKRSIEDHFDSNFELEYNLKEKGKTDLLRLVDESTGIRLHFIRQSHPRGLGDAVLQAKAFVGNEPFVVLLGDDLMDINGTDYPLTKQAHR